VHKFLADHVGERDALGAIVSGLALNGGDGIDDGGDKAFALTVDLSDQRVFDLDVG
jgi:hypothetical protein